LSHCDVHVVCAALDQVLAPQVVHESVLPGAAVPSVHATHAVRPSLAAVPGVHDVQAAPPELALPVVHATHLRTPSSSIGSLPSPHGLTQADWSTEA
jgi:hypothetical protein